MSKPIIVNHEEIVKKVSELKKMQSELKQIAKIPALEFGTNSSSCSTGQSSNAMKLLNQEYDGFIELF